MINEEAEKKFIDESKDRAYNLFLELYMIENMSPSQLINGGYIESEYAGSKNNALLTRLRTEFRVAQKASAEHLKKYPTPRNPK